MTGGLIRGGEKTQRQRHEGKRRCEDGGSDWISVATVKAGLGPPEAGKRRDASSPRGFREGMTWPTPGFQNSGLQTLGRINFCCFRPPSLWYFAMPAVGN